MTEYIHRNIDSELIAWKEDSMRKPLLLRGARQVGKSSAVKNLGKQFEYFAEVNFERLLTCRISLAWAAYRVFPIKIAGQMLPDWPALDNIFVYLLYLTGPVMVVLVCALMMAALYGYARRGQWQAVACLVTMLAYGYMESQVTHLTSDPAVLLLCGAVYALPTARWMFEED